MHSITGPAISDDVDIAALLRALKQRKIWILGFATLTAIATYIALGFVTPRYSSEARVLIEREDNYYKRPANSRSQGQGSLATDQETVSSQVQVMQSRDLALGVVKDLQLENVPEFNSGASAGFILPIFKGLLGFEPDSSPQAVQERVLDSFMDRLSVYQLEKSRVIAIEFQSNNPETAAKVANRLADLYLTWQQSEKLKQTKEASNWLSVQIAQLTKRVEEAEVAAEKFRSSTGLFEGSNNTNLDAQQLSELNSQIIVAKAQRTEAEARASLIKHMLKEKGDVAGAADVLNSNLIQRLLEQRVRVQRALAEASVSLLPSHPRIRELNSELRDLKRQIRDEASKVISSLENEAQIAGAREMSLRQSLKELKETASKGNENQIKLRALERELTSNRELLELYLARYRDASARSEQGSVPAHASIVSRAHISSQPTFPRKGPISLLAFATIAFLGFAQTIARELIRPEHSRHPASHPANNPKQPVHPGQIDGFSDEGIVAVESLGELARYIGQPRNRNTVIMPMPGVQNATSDVLSAIRMIAADGKATILIDALGLGDGVARALELPDGPGMHELVTGAAIFEETVRRDPHSTLQLISGNLGRSSSQSIRGERFAEMATALDAAYDHVIYLAGPDESIAILANAARFNPTLVLLTEPGISVEESLWQADQIFGDKVDQPSLIVLANIVQKSRVALPFRFGRRLGIG